MYVVTVHQRYRQTDRQTDDIGYDSNNVLRAVKTVSVSRQESRAVAGNPRDAAVIFDP